MKKKYAIAFAAVSALLIPASCQRFDEQGPAFQDNGSFTITVNCPDDTRTGIDGTKPVWKAGDEVWVSDGSSSCKAVVDKKYDGLSHADFEVSGLSGDSLYVLYPYDNTASVSGGRILVSVPSVQSGEFGDAGICLGSCSKSTPAITLHNVSAVLHFVCNNETLVTMQLDNLDNAIAGKMTFAAESGKIGTYSVKSPCIRMDFEDRHNEFYLALAPSTFSSNARIFFTTSEHCIGTIDMSQNNVLEQGVIYEMGNISEHIVFDSKPATDLSARESANCYVVESGKSYRFRTVKGNSGTQLEDIAYAAVLWETVNTASAPVKRSLIDEVVVGEDEIYFKVPASAPNGNAIIAAYNTAGEIVWSWHIWIVDGGVSFHTLASGYFLMDRNLGALTGTPGNATFYGLLYQWGRKDPFLTGQGLSSTTQARLTGKAIAKVNCSASTGTLDYSIKNPTTIIYNTAGGSWLNEDMLLWSGEVKTMYDPCPPGYHIPTQAVLKLLKNGVWNSSYKTLDFTINGESVSIPAAGKTNYNNGSLSNVGSAGNYWYSSSSGSTNTSCFSVKSDGTHFYTQNSSNPYPPQSFSVRCQKVSDKDESQAIRITYNVTMPDYRYKSFWYSSKVNGSNILDWGDGARINMKDSVTVYHAFGSTGKYTVSMQGYDIDFVRIRSLGDIAEIDLSNF